MDYFLSYESMLKAKKKQNKIRLDAYLVHAFAMYLGDSFTAEYVASILDMKLSDVRHTLKLSHHFYEDEGVYHKCKHMATLYDDALKGSEDGMLVDPSFSDIKALDVPLYDPVVNLCMKAVNTYGDCLTLVGVSLLLAINEGVSCPEALKVRLQTETPLQPYLDKLVEKKILSRKDVDGKPLYRVGAIGGHIYKTIFKSRPSR